MYHRPTFKTQFDEAGCKLQVKTGRNIENRSGFDAELVLPQRHNKSLKYQGTKHQTPTNTAQFSHMQADDSIRCLILTVKASDTIAALTPILHRLSHDSTILFLQNGKGSIEECNKQLFPDHRTRPAYMVGVNSHGTYGTSPIATTHAGLGSIMLGTLPITSTTEANSPSAESNVGLRNAASQHLLQSLTRVPVLAAIALAPAELLQVQVEKLAINCLIGPLTVMLDCRNGDLLNNFAISRTMVLLLAEISLIIQSLPELQGVPNLKLRFSPERLQHLTLGVAEKTAANISSMLQDVRRGVRTEVEYINGYMVGRGEEVGIKPVMNYMLMQLVIGKQQMVQREMDNYVPFASRLHGDDLSRGRTNARS